jgi:hypothetical protein
MNVATPGAGNGRRVDCTDRYARDSDRLPAHVDELADDAIFIGAERAPTL